MAASLDDGMGSEYTDDPPPVLLSHLHAHVDSVDAAPKRGTRPHRDDAGGGADGDSGGEDEHADESNRAVDADERDKLQEVEEGSTPMPYLGDNPSALVAVRASA